MEYSTNNETGTTPWWVPARRFNLAILAGLLVTLGLPPMAYTGVMVPLGLAVLFVALKDAPRPAFLMWIFALVHQTSLLYWLFLLIPAKSIPTKALVPIQASLAILYVSVFYLLLGWVYGRLRWRIGPARALLALPVLWVGMEALRARGEMAFPWCLTGSVVVDGPLMGLLRASGEIGVSALVVFSGMSLSCLWLWLRGGENSRTPSTVALGGTAVLLVAMITGSLLTPEIPLKTDISVRVKPLKIAAIQANVSLDDKWQGSKIDSTRAPYKELSLEAADNGAEFIVWAETAMPAYIRHDKSHLNWVRKVIHSTNVPLYTGFPDAQRLPDGTVNKYNSSGLFAANGSILDRYAKYHLLPIGEAMPFTSIFPALAKINVGQAEWTPGQPPEAIFLPTDSGDFPFSGLICFESILAAQARDSVRRGSRMLVVLTNDGWFGETAGPRQHTKMALLRAVECGVPMVRCANNGISLICDEKGSVQDVLDLGQRGYVMADVVPGSGQTAYVRWGAWPLFWFLLLWLVVAFFVRSHEEEEK